MKDNFDKIRCTIPVIGVFAILIANFGNSNQDNSLFFIGLIILCLTYLSLIFYPSQALNQSVIFRIIVFMPIVIFSGLLAFLLLFAYI